MSEQGVAAQLRNLLDSVHPKEYAFWLPEDTAKFQKVKDDALAVLATHICVDKQQLHDLYEKYERWHYLSYRTLLEEIQEDMKGLLLGRGVEATSPMTQSMNCPKCGSEDVIPRYHRGYGHQCRKCGHKW